ncbi:MAG: hypothetical protein GWP08_05455 [Nitrospiraceae bacterium]|nr:hypothetical protein [Nitrospiraceae bacterium]
MIRGNTMQDALQQARQRLKWALFFFAIMVAAIMAVNMVRGDLRGQRGNSGAPVVVIEDTQETGP